MPTKAKFQFLDVVRCPDCNERVYVTNLHGRGPRRKATLTCDCSPHGFLIADLSKVSSKPHANTK